jgi:hypothetical protein
MESKKMKSRFRSHLPTSLLFGLLILAACSGSAPVGSNPDLADEVIPTDTPEPVPTVNTIPTDTPLPAVVEETVATTEAPQPTETADAIASEKAAEATESPVPPEPTVSPTELSPPTPRAELAATDPQEFNLASGELQLVEFFAHW